MAPPSKALVGNPQLLAGAIGSAETRPSSCTSMGITSASFPVLAGNSAAFEKLAAQPKVLGISLAIPTAFAALASHPAAFAAIMSQGSQFTSFARAAMPSAMPRRKRPLTQAIGAMQRRSNASPPTTRR